MQQRQKRNIYWILLLTNLIFLSSGTFASPGNPGLPDCSGPGNGGIVASTVLDGSLHQIAKDSSRSVVDSAFFNPANSNNLDTTYTVQNQVTLMINEASTLYLRSAFTVNVQLRISYTTGSGPNDTASVIRNFTVNYDSTTNYNSRSSFVFNGAHQVTVKVLSVTSNVTAWDPTSVLVIENQLLAKPQFLFNCNTTVTGIAVNPSDSANADELPVSWTAVQGADQYDVEWTFIDANALTDTSALMRKRYGRPWNPALIFRNSATRVSVTGTSYNIPLMYDDSGTLFIRVRPVQIKNAYSVTAAVWSSDAPSAVMGQYTFTGHERPLNWQSNISFAEEGKRKVVVQYYDGSLRSRQTVTKDNTTNTTIVGETYYDYQGRPAIQVMPSPTLGNIIKYTAGFNVSINGAEYSQSNYDTLPYMGTFCGIHADSMSNLSGASNYYSPRNPTATLGLDQFIPDAHDYPFTETEYTHDNTGRISRQGGVGLYHQLNSGHETKYYYGTPDQHELDALFGLEVGDHSHYFKNMVRDANGQYSISYVDMHGRTIATSLAGNAPLGISTLSSNVDSTVTETLADSKTVYFQDLSMLSQKSLVVSAADSFQFNYSLNPSALTGQNCQQQPICYTCRYDLEITISSDCNNLLPGGVPFDTIIHNFTPGAAIVASCSPASPMNVNFSLYLQEGSYVVTKKLTANRDAYNYYRDSVYIPNNTCNSLQQYINQQKTIAVSANPQCAVNCSACRASIGSWPQFWANYIAQGGLTSSDTAAYSQQAYAAYQKAVSSCSALCGDSASDYEDIRNAMLQDMTPPFGQYADTTKLWSKYSIFYIAPKDSAQVYKLPGIQYLSDNGIPDSIYLPQSELNVTPNSVSVTQFVQNFRPSWAEALLPYHPEYCKLQELNKHRLSNIWDRRMQAIDNYEDAYNLGYLNPTGNSNYPYPVVSGNIDPFTQENTGGYLPQLTSILTAYLPAGSNTAYPLWGFACAMVNCNSSDKSCYDAYAHGAKAFDTTKMCPGDRDMAWRNFREIYLEKKHDIINKLVASASGCTFYTSAYNAVPSPEVLSQDSLHSEFFSLDPSDKNNILSKGPLGALYNSAGDPNAAAQQQAAAKTSSTALYQQNAVSLSAQWAAQLAPCNYPPDQLKNNILPALVDLCFKASDSLHPFGASSMPNGTVSTYGYSSFQNILAYYNTLDRITDTLHCNAEMITAPAPYYNQPNYSNEPVYTRPSACECTLISNFYHTYRVSGQGDPSFSAYLLRTQQINMSDGDLNQLVSMCNNKNSGNGNSTSSCTWLAKPIYLPPAMQCDVGTTCASCTLVDTVYQHYLAQYPGNVPMIGSPYDSVQTRKNILFQNYMNNRIGFSKQASEYLQFIATCASQKSSISDSTKCAPRQVANIFQLSGTDQMKDIHPSVDGGYIAAGSTTGIGAGGMDAYIIRANDTGTVQWAKTWGGTGDDYFSRVKQTSDHGYIAIGTTKSGQYVQGEVLIVKMNAAGNTQWEREIGFATPLGEAGYDIIQTSDGGYAALGLYNQYVGTGNLLLARLDTGGNVSWVHQFGASMSSDPKCYMSLPDTIPYNGVPAYGLVESGDSLLITGTDYDLSRPGRYFGAIYRVGKYTGNVGGSWHYQDSSDSTMSSRFGDIYATANGFLVSVTNAQHYGSAGSQTGVLSLSASGTVNSFKRFNLPPGSSKMVTSGMYPMLDGGYLVAQTGDNTPHIFWQRMDASGNLLWSNETILTGMQSLGRVIQNQDSTFTAVGTNNNQALILNVLPKAFTDCFDSTLTMGLTNPPLALTNFGILTDGYLTPGNTSISLTETLASPAYTSLTCNDGGGCYNVYTGPTLCGKAAPIFAAGKIDSTTTCTDSTFFAVSKGTELFKVYSDSLTGDFEQRYNNTCLQAYKYEHFTVTHKDREYHYTLYYYDQAGNLIKTVPPAGVQKMADTSWMNSVDSARLVSQVLVPSLVPAHKLATNYRYNSLNQVVSQRSPDGGTSYFWYDRLGRLALSQNARQKPNNQYSYTQYDSIGRIVQVGQLVSGTAITDTLSRVEAALALWENNAAGTADQITATAYDTAAYAIIPELSPQNVRNRVASTALYNKYADMIAVPANQAAATYYSYDILGNVDTLVQDFKQGSMANNGNRFKKLAYNFDLVSGKVNQVSYQQGFGDAFFHSYVYDAENRITNVQSSLDGTNWDNDAFYSYYAHGPLARTILGQQQVQGINYAYTLQGWLKAINPAPYTGGSFNLRPDSVGNVVANNAYNLTLNYFKGDYNPISVVAGVDSALNNAAGNNLGGDFRPLYNGNISSMGVNVHKLTNPLLYNYQYDQLNRLVGMDAWNRTANSWNAITKIADFQERIAYDPNGNIQKYRRNGNNTFAGKPLAMDSLGYFYTAGTNKLDHITDSVLPGNYTTDINGQSAGNYQYDSIGQLVSDAASGISNITWTVYGKIASITKSGDSTLLYTYDPGGNRISKSIVHAGDTLTTWYVRDAQGNVLSVYTYGDPSVRGKDLTQTELHIYGSSRLGILKMNTDMERFAPANTATIPLLGLGDSLIFTRGTKLFELTNHLGNVLATISDKRYGVSKDDSTVAYFNPEVVSAQDYYPFGMLQPGRNYTENSAGNYRYGFNGKENDNEVKGMGNEIDYGMRVYDPRTGRFLSLDPLSEKYPFYTPYQFSGNKPIWAIDLDGEEEKLSTDKKTLNPGLTILNVSSKKAVYEFNQYKYKHPTGNFNKAEILKGASYHDIALKKQNPEAVTWLGELAANSSSNGVKLPHELNPILSVTEISATTKATEIDLGKFGKYIQVETTTSTTDVDIVGSAMQDVIRSIKKTTTTTIGYQKIVSDNSDGSVDLSFKAQDYWSETSVKVENVPLAPKYEDNLKKLTSALATEVNAANQENKAVMKKAFETLNDNQKEVEKKANNGDYVPKK